MVKNIIKVVLLCVIALSIKCFNRDHIDPTVYIVNPIENSIVSGAIRIKVVAMDNKEVTCVEFFINNVRNGVDSTASNSIYEYVWNTSSESSGPKTVTAKGYDQAGNIGESPSVIVTIEVLGPTYHSGSITTNQTWAKKQSPHIILGNVEISSMLFIEAGTVIRFSRPDSPPWNSSMRILENGDIIARGTTNEPILFTSNEELPSVGYWEGIYLDQSENDNSFFDNCIIEYADSGIQLQERTISVTNTLIQYCSGYGLVCEHGQFRYFQNNIITKNYDNPISLTADAVSSLETNNYLLGNYNLEYGDVIEVMDGEISHSGTWRNQCVPYYIAGDIYLEYHEDPPPVLTIEPDCVLAFDNNGIEMYELTKLQASGVTFTSITSLIGYPNTNDWYGIYTDGSSLNLEDCIIEYGGNNYGAGISCSGIYEGQSITINNCIIRYIGGYGILFENIEQELANIDIRNTRIHNCDDYPVMLTDADYIRGFGPGNNFVGNYTEGFYVTDNGLVTTSGIWYNCGTPYIIDTDLELEQGWQNTPPTITIMPGVIMKFVDAYLKVDEGTIIADGSMGTIVFTADEDNGGWHGIIFGNGTNDYLTRLNHCIIQYSGISYITQRANIFCYNSSPRITNCDICYSEGWGIALQNSLLDPDTLRRYNRFYNNDSGDVYIVPPDKAANLNTIERIQKKTERISIFKQRGNARKPIKERKNQL